MQLRRRSVATVDLEIVAGPFDVVCQNLNYRSIQVWANNDSQAIDLLGIRRHRMGSQNPAPFSYLVRNIELVVPRVSATTGMRCVLFMIWNLLS